MPGTESLRDEYQRVCCQAGAGDPYQRRAALDDLLSRADGDATVQALCHSDLGVLAAAQGQVAAARDHLARALKLDPRCDIARRNWEMLLAADACPPRAPATGPQRPRIAVLGLLFNWPPFGGGCAHSAGLCTALAQDGHEVLHLFARQREFRVGATDAPYAAPHEPLVFSASEWRTDAIKRRFRDALRAYGPDVVVVMDTWSFKPHLWEVAQDRAVLLRFDAQECLCPLNNCRLLSGSQGFSQCPHHQLATPEICLRCVGGGRGPGNSINEWEQELSGVDRPGYPDLLRQSLRGASAALVNNPLIAEMLGPYARQVKVIPPGVDAARFPWRDQGGPDRQPGEPAQILMAGVIEAPGKGFPVLHEACRMLWARRQDFRLFGTGQQRGSIDAFTHSVGWHSQEELPALYRSADICVSPSVVQESWSIVAVESMAAGRPVVASRTGGLQFLVGDGGEGLLFEPGDPTDLADCLEQLLDDPERRREMGRRARARFENYGSWDALLARHYRPLLRQITGADVLGPAPARTEAVSAAGWR